MSHVLDQLRDDEYIGYTLHYASRSDYQHVATHLADKVAAGRKSFCCSIHPRAHENFLFVRADVKTTKNVVLCMIKKDPVLREYSHKVCFHKEETTVVDGLADTMQLATARSDCRSYYPARVESQPAVDADIASTAGSAIQGGKSDVATGSAVTAGSERPSVRRVVPESWDYREKFPVLFLTPILFSDSDGLSKRGEAYTFCSHLITSDRGDVYAGHKDGMIVSIKDIGVHALAGKKLARTVRELFTLEKGHDRGVCFPRILDVFTSSSESLDCRLYLVFEVWGLPLHLFRTLKDYGREDAPPIRHIRKLVQHTCKALDYLHNTLWLLHTDVTLANIIVKALPASMAGAISCRLGGFTLLEEACLPSFIGGGSTGRSVRDRGTLDVPRANG